jgi:transglutaminase-like putative cysteine protease
MFLIVASMLLAAAPAERHFHVQQAYDVPAQSSAASVFVPVPQDDPWQTITGLSIEGAPYELVREAKYGDQAARFAVPASGAHVVVSFDVVRHERAADLSKATAKPAPDAYGAYLGSDTLVPLDDRVKKIAADVTAGKKTPLEKAQAIYAYVLGHMRYEKKGEGWGRGSIAWACDSKYGNCTDFHALLIGLLRASGIPARFQIGYAVPPGSGELAGYHCWADFYLEGTGWVPVDASEAWKHAELRDYYFGHHDANRFALSMGRDLSFPGMKGAPLNYFVYAYAEADGKPVANLTRKVTVTDLGPLTER